MMKAIIEEMMTITATDSTVSGNNQGFESMLPCESSNDSNRMTAIKNLCRIHYFL
jgi:hypothetical protein